MWKYTQASCLPYKWNMCEFYAKALVLSSWNINIPTSKNIWNLKYFWSNDFQVRVIMNIMIWALCRPKSTIFTFSHCFGRLWSYFMQVNLESLKKLSSFYKISTDPRLTKHLMQACYRVEPVTEKPGNQGATGACSSRYRRSYLFPETSLEMRKRGYIPYATYLSILISLLKSGW